MMDRFLKIACEAAEEGIQSGDGGPFGAVVVKEDQVIATGHNRVLISHDSTAHAEIEAIRRAEQILGTHDLSGCTLYTTCYPCPMCLGAILWAHIDTVVYASTPADAASIGFDDQRFYQAVNDPESTDLLTIIHYASEDCRTLFEKWFEMPSKTLY